MEHSALAVSKVNPDGVVGSVLTFLACLLFCHFVTFNRGWAQKDKSGHECEKQVCNINVSQSAYTKSPLGHLCIRILK